MPHKFYFDKADKIIHYFLFIKHKYKDIASLKEIFK